MSIKSITLQNFKGIGESVCVELKPITLLFGANSAGKSTILQALLFAREILERANTDPDKTIQGGDAVDLGGFRNLVHNHDANLPISLRFDLDLTDIDLVDYSDYPDSPAFQEWSGQAMSAWVQLDIKWSSFLEQPTQADYEVGINGVVAAKVTADDSTGLQHVVSFNIRHPWFCEGLELEPSDVDIKWDDRTTVDYELSQRANSKHETLFDEIRSVFAARDLGEFSELINFCLISPGEYLRSNLRKLKYLGPIRVVPDRTYQPSKSPDESRWSTGLAAWDWINDASLSQVDELNKWLTWETRLNTGYRVDVKRYKELDVDGMAMSALSQGEDFLDNYEMIRQEIEALPEKKRLLLRQEKDFLDVAPQDVGIGISQVIPVVVAALAQKSGIAAIEQPELHIHPAVQVALGDLFIQQTNDEAGFSRQFLIETHSEHLLLRLLRRIRQSSEGQVAEELKLSPDRVAVYYVESSSQGTVLKHLRINEEGRFDDRWPRGFFEEREKEYFGDLEDLSEEIGRMFD
ncbi:DUF3696 domain-containing protein [Methylomonas sp. SURF-2]|uniref:DUF3696 domain-containing protein n=1 Tax=Methylomonas subterranea TaxID=2952225 RepID=A0ABT1TKJ0_9GAMM|nr:DUF3696 domain-containing protein [Methylomonas sp. SURF-2]MCQ8105988.1 DUF3696 domain-containing protein [Methylomonas sp. SURF-2]